MLAIVSHDAGGAELLSSFVHRQGVDALFVLDGPARMVFERKLGHVEITSLQRAVDACDSVLCGSSGQSNLEFNAIRMARTVHRRSVAFLDHWINYAERFTRGNETNLPDEIWVGDAVGEMIARNIFQGIPVHVVDNPYFADLREQFSAIESRRAQDHGISVLYVAEPLRAYALAQFGNERHYGYVEEEALRYFLANIDVLGRSIERIRIRPHPSEPSGKYAWACSEFDLPIEVGVPATLVQDIADSDVVVGCESMAMVVGLLAEKRVISCIPPGGRACRLPQAKIEHYRQLLTTRQS